MLILAIDPGRKAGAALFLRGVLIDSWQVKPGGEAAVVAEAIVRAEGEPIVVVRENWSLGGRRGEGSASHQHIGMLAGLGAAWGRWDGALLGAGIPTSRVVKVYARTWQASVISGRALTRAETLRIAVNRARAIAHRDVGEDEAVAICIGLWATKAPEVLAVLSIADGKRLGIDVKAAREFVAGRKATKAARKVRRARAA